MRIVVFTLLIGLPVLGQSVAPRPANTYHVPKSNAVAAVSPEVHADRTVTFRISAPDATGVTLGLEGDHAMAKDASGSWSVTLGPLAPEIYEYSFRIGGAKVIDGGNKFVKTGPWPPVLWRCPVSLLASTR